MKMLSFLDLARSVLCSLADKTFELIITSFFIPTLVIFGPCSMDYDLIWQTKAFEYFERAASTKQDADSLFNAAHCLNTGTGTDQDLQRCVIAI